MNSREMDGVETAQRLVPDNLSCGSDIVDAQQRDRGQDNIGAAYLVRRSAGHGPQHLNAEQPRGHARDSGALCHPQFQAPGLWLGHDELERSRGIQVDHQYRSSSRICARVALRDTSPSASPRGGVGGMGPGLDAGVARPCAIRRSSSGTPVLGAAGMMRATGRPYSLISTDSPALTRSSTLAVCRFSSLTVTDSIRAMVLLSTTRRAVLRRTRSPGTVMPTEHLIGPIPCAHPSASPYGTNQVSSL